MPLIGRLRLLRQWAGLCDMTMDGSPIIEAGLLPGLYLNTGWNYGGFKATPASGWCFAHMIARDEPHPLRRADAARPLPHRPRDRRKGSRRAAESCTDADRLSLLRRARRPGVRLSRRRDRPPARSRRAGRRRARSTTTSICATTPPAPHRELWYHAAGCRRWVEVERDTRTHAISAARFAADGRRADEPPRRRRPDRPRRAARASPSTAARSPASPATRSPRRCSPTTSSWSAARSSITGRAGSSAPGRRSRTRWSTLRAGARREPNMPRDHGRALRRARGGEPEPLALARVRPAGGRPACSRRFSAPASTTRPSCGRRRRGRSSTSRRSARAAGLGRAPEAADPDRYEKAHAFCDVLVVGAGPAGLMAALAAGRAGARVILAEEDFRFGGRLLSENSRDRRRAAGRRSSSRRVAELRSLPNVRLMPRTVGLRRLRRLLRGASSGSATICRAGAVQAAPGPVAHRRQARRAGGGRDRPADRVRRQRPARRDAGRAGRRPTSIASPSRPARRHGVLRQSRRALDRRLRRARRRRRAWRR